MRRVSLGSVILYTSAALLLGCGGADARKSTVQAGGTVIYESGQPVMNLGIVFLPVGGAKYSGHGRLTSEGKFTLSTYGENDGVPVGKYQVYLTVAPPESARPPKGPAPGAAPPPPPATPPD